MGKHLSVAELQEITDAIPEGKQVSLNDVISIVKETLDKPISVTTAKKIVASGPFAFHSRTLKNKDLYGKTEITQITNDFVENILKIIEDTIDKQERSDEIKKHIACLTDILIICKSVSGYYNLNLSQMRGKTRKREIVQPRQIAMYFAKKYTKASLSLIGSQIGGKDHATVLSACRTVKNLIETDKAYSLQIHAMDKIISFQIGVKATD